MKSFKQFLFEGRIVDDSKIWKALGYPKCCTDYFFGTMPKRFSGELKAPVGPWTGTGFIPCPKHAEEFNKHGYNYMVQRINSKRNKLLEPFPNLIPTGNLREKVITAINDMTHLNRRKRPRKRR